MFKQKQIIFLFLFLCCSTFLHAQYKISGFVKDANTDETLIGAHIQEQNTNNAAVTNNQGYFSIVVNKEVSLSCSFVGFELLNLSLNITSDTSIYLLLKPGSEIEEVTIKALASHTNNSLTINQKELMLLPSISAKPDVLKTAQMMPGIQAQTEASSVLIVRGGDPGQNLYLLDNAQLIYVNHLGGFMSVFNPDIINNITIYKAGFPSKYGGKLSSVVNITQKQGNKNRMRGSFSIGLTDVNFMVEGPLSKKFSFILTGRRTLFDILYLGLSKSPFISNSPNNLNVSYGFHDINGKIVWHPNPQNTIQLNVYQGDDYLNYKSDNNAFNEIMNAQTTNKNIWGNWLVNTTWNKILSKSVFVTNSLSYGFYRLKNEQSLSSSDVDYSKVYLSSVGQTAFKSDWYQVLGTGNELKYGLHSKLIKYNPEYQSMNGASSYEADKYTSLENAIYGNGKFNLKNILEINIGVRLVHYKQNSFTSFNAEPRLDLTYKLNSEQQFNMAYSKMNQNSHLLFTTGSFMSNQIWIPATSGIGGSSSDQYSIGWGGFFYERLFRAEITAYYKHMKNLVTYKPGSSNLGFSNQWEDYIEKDGYGKSTGLEFLVKKNYGDYTGLISYTYSQSTRTYEDLNNGKEFWYTYHRPHALSLTINKKLNSKLSLSAAWVFNSGLPYTPVIGRHYTPSVENIYRKGNFNYEALIYGERNSGKLPDYHRLDISLNYETKTKKNNKAIWTFAVYNVYNRQNANAVYYNNNESSTMYRPENGEGFQPLNMYQISYFPILPSISYKVYFEGNSNKKTKKPLGSKFVDWLYYK